MNIGTEVEQTHRVLGTRADVLAITLTRGYPTDQADLWAACTEPDRLARWFLPVHGDLRVGGRFQLEGNAGGTITACEPPRALDATWEFGAQSSRIELRLHPDGDHTRLELTHLADPDDETWARYGPAATGLGWELALRGLAEHLRGDTPSPTWAASAEGVAYLTAAAEAWVPVSVAGGLDPDDARARAERALAFYTGTEADR